MSKDVHAVFIANPETKLVHVGVRSGNSVKLDPRCNLPTARKEGEKGTEYIEPDAALDYINKEGYLWCGWCATPEKDAS